MSDPSGERGSATALDGHELAVTRYAASGDAWGTMLVAPAMGVRQDFYGPIARYLAANGLHVLTFDFRGMGWSRQGALKGFKADMTDWVERDLEAMLREARKRAPGLPLLYLGHSLGGQLLAAAPSASQVAAAVTFASGSGYYRLNDRMPKSVRILWFLVVPALTRLHGYFPGKRIRVVGDLPKGVALQWRRWCLHPQYLLAEGEAMRGRFARFSAPILSYSFEDDDMITREAVDSLNGFFASAAVERRHLVPAEIGERRIGHFGFFAARSRDKLWRPLLDWLRARATST